MERQRKHLGIAMTVGSIAYRNHLHLSAVAPGIESVVIFVLGLSITGPNLIE